MSLAEFHFIRPYWLLALIPTLFIFFALLKNKLNQGNWSAICDPALLPFVIQDRDVNHSHQSLSVGSVASLLIIIALAGPTWERLPSPVFRNDAALVIALDLSRSMDVTDITPSRLSRARFKIADILQQRKDGQTALLVYAGDVFTVTPLTADNETIASQISALTTEIMPSQGSNTLLAIEKSVELLQQSGLQKGDILLVTDEVDFDSTIGTVQSLAGYRLSILGVGTEEGAPIKDRQGGFVKDAAGNIVIPRLNSQELSQLASEGNGLYIKMTPDDTDLETLLKQFNHAFETQNEQGSENNNWFLEQWHEQGPWLLLLALPLAALSFRKGLLSFALICLLPMPEPGYAMEWKDLWSTQNQQAQQAFKQHNFQQAAEQYDNPQWKAAAHYKAGQFEQTIETLQNDTSANGLYNKANALAQTGKLPEALEAYEKSLTINPDNEDAKYNKAQVKKEIEKQQQQNSDSDSDPSEQENSEPQKQHKPGDKSKQSDENNNAEKNEDSADSEQQPDEKQSDDHSDAEPSPAEQSEEQQQKTENTAEQPDSSDYDESEQASEQWLKRIPDDPAGLLKRKFKYQYGQRGQKNTHQKNW
ncbi:MAG: VWA domain-containing protein [Methylococcales bacterium]|nr:VWA domain-containing protein [Methylococcaceae bacterium]